VVRCAHAKVAQTERAIIAAGAALEQAGGERRLICTGHSLGGAVAALVALLFAAEHRDWRVEAYTFGSASTCEESLARARPALTCVRSFVFRDDCVPRLSRFSLEYLKHLTKSIVHQARSNALTPKGTSVNASKEELVAPPPPARPQGRGWMGKVADKMLGRVDADAAVEEARTAFARTSQSMVATFPAGRVFLMTPMAPQDSPSVSSESISPFGTPSPTPPLLDQQPSPSASPVIAAAPSPCLPQPTAVLPVAVGAPTIVPPQTTSPTTGSEKDPEPISDRQLAAGVNVIETDDIHWLSEITISDKMVSDHLLATYFKAIDALAKLFLITTTSTTTTTTTTTTPSE
jgi:hypothetical protein